VFDLEKFLRQSPYSTPGRYARRLAALPDDLESLCAASRNVVGQYRVALPNLPEERRGEIGSRWLVGAWLRTARRDQPSETVIGPSSR
jgi:hypothetical protein